VKEIPDSVNELTGDTRDIWKVSGNYHLMWATILTTRPPRPLWYKLCILSEDSNICIFH